MLAELRTKSQITIPKEIVNSLGLSEGDKLEVYEKDGMICILPVAVYPKRYVDDLHREIEGIKSDISAGKTPVFDNIDALFEQLESKLRNAEEQEKAGQMRSYDDFAAEMKAKYGNK